MLAAQPGLAQGLPGDPATPDAADRQAAAAHFQKGEAAFKAGDFRAAGQSFDAAYESAPHHSPLWNGARAWQEAGEPARAANRYAQYLRESPEAAPDRGAAKAALDALVPGLGVLRIPSDVGDPVVDGERVRDRGAHYVSPGDHDVRGEVTGTMVTTRVTVRAGEQRLVELAPPQPTTPVPGTAVSPPPPAPAPPPATSPEADAPAKSSSGWPLWIALTSGGLTVLAGAHTIWSGVDTLNARDEFDREPTEAKLEDGRRRQTRTNFLLGLTTAFGAFTVVSLVLTDWGGDDQDAPRVGVGPGSLVVSGSF